MIVLLFEYSNDDIGIGFSVDEFFIQDKFGIFEVL